jgi:hypothetical protein
MHFLHGCALLAGTAVGALVLATSAAAQPATVADVKYEATSGVNGSTLQLN